MTTYSQFVAAHNELLPEDHPTVVRRLARELNAHGWQSGKAFYCSIAGSGNKFTIARVRKGKLQVSMCKDGWFEADPKAHFDDGNGNRIAATRTKCGH